MTSTILKTSAIPIYAFLSYIADQQLKGELEEQISVLECGAGGEKPPLALFAEHGIKASGIDTSNEQIEKALQYCLDTGVDVELKVGDMRQIPYENEEFDCVYEHYSMCHLSKAETLKTIREMYRVTKKHGLCYLGIISMDTWPKSMFGNEKEPGEYWVEEFGKLTRHSLFSTDEADLLVKDWEILSKEKHVSYLLNMVKSVTVDNWMEMHKKEMPKYTEAEWRAAYDQRNNMYNYSHIYYLLRKG